MSTTIDDRRRAGRADAWMRAVTALAGTTEVGEPCACLRAALSEAARA